MSPEAGALDLNADLGESFGVYAYGQDDAMLDLVTSANVACGFHAGDPRTMARAVDAAVERGVRIGAHVGLPDRFGFGRRRMEITPDDAYADAVYQIGALAAFVAARGAALTHVKPHGSLYMQACEDVDLAEALARAARDVDPRLAVYALPHSELARAAVAAGLDVYPEYFADRPYVAGQVQMFGWTPADLGDPQQIAERARLALTRVEHTAYRTVCVHSDTPGAPQIARAVHAVLRDLAATPTIQNADLPA